ncbi:MAG: hypothetical protein RLZZ127_1908 [Planctomycetota bacterium]|jgi:DNA-binding transcriptional LysR family regulator
MDLRHLRMFAAVATHLGFRRAAEALQVAQPAVSSAIADLERSLGVRLFERSRHRVALTAHGRELLAEAAAVLAAAERVRDRARRLARGEAGRLRIGFMATAAMHILPQAIRSFRSAHPGFVVTAEELSPDRQVADLLADRIDVALTRPDPGAVAAGIREDLVEVDRLRIALPADHPAARRQRVALADVAEGPIILFNRSGSAHLAQAAAELARAAGVDIANAVEARTMAAALLLVASGLGVAIVPGCVAHLQQPGVVLRPADPQAPEVPLVAARRGDREVPGAEALVAACRRAARQSRRA